MTLSPRAALALRGIGLPEGCRVRGEQVSRVEGFSDAAFAFSITLLVISLEVPNSFYQLLNGMRGLPAFAICFATVVWLWCSHYAFFRRYGLEDPWTIVLNSALLFVIMFYVFPLKFLFTMAIGEMTGIHPSATVMELSPVQVRQLFLVYGIGVIAAFGLFGLMNARAWRLRDALGLNEVERLVTREEMARCFGDAGVGALSILIAYLLPLRWAGAAGFSFVLIGVVETMVGSRYGTLREAALQRMRSSGEWPAGPAPRAG
jgi:uncharacterized membrane protein